jgi:hypothetical protein
MSLQCDFRLPPGLYPTQGLLLRYERPANILHFLQVLPSVFLLNKCVLN